MRRLILIGQLGMGKSSLGNALLNQNKFSVGCQNSAVTVEVQIEESLKYKIFDCPGYGDVNDEYRFFKKFLEHKNVLIKFAPINAIVIVVKFDQRESNNFLDAAKNCYSAFGKEGLKSVMLVCIQANDRLIMSNADFKKCLFESDGYTFLKEKNDAQPIPYCLWDNLNPNRYPTQQEDFDDCLLHLRALDRRSLNFSFELIERELARP